MAALEMRLLLQLEEENPQLNSNGDRPGTDIRAY
jgi:hypothetical protein